MRTKVWTAYISIRVLVPPFHSASDTPETPSFVPPAVFAPVLFNLRRLSACEDGAAFNFPHRTVLNGGAPLLNNNKKNAQGSILSSQPRSNFFFHLSVVILLF